MHSRMSKLFVKTLFVKPASTNKELNYAQAFAAADENGIGFHALVADSQPKPSAAGHFKKATPAAPAKAEQQTSRKLSDDEVQFVMMISKP